MNYYPPMRVVRHSDTGVVNVETKDSVLAYIPNRDVGLAAVFAASVEMLNALEELVGEYDQKESVHIPWSMARAAIKKAKTRP